MSNNKRGFSMVELVIVAIIVGILFAIGVPLYQNAQERTFDKDAVASLKLIQAAERIYRMEQGEYYPAVGAPQDDELTINENLKLYLPTDESKMKWGFSVTNSGAGFSASAVRTGGTKIRTWTIPDPGTAEEPTCSGTGCPAP